MITIEVDAVLLKHMEDIHIETVIDSQKENIMLCTLEGPITININKLLTKLKEQGIEL